MTSFHLLPLIIPRQRFFRTLRARLDTPPFHSPNRFTATMSWRSSSTTNEGLVANLYKNGLVSSDAAREAMLKVDRAHFCPILPYEDSPQTIGYDATISAPHIHASVSLFSSLSFFFFPLVVAEFCLVGL